MFGFVSKGLYMDFLSFMSYKLWR